MKTNISDYIHILEKLKVLQLGRTFALFGLYGHFELLLPMDYAQNLNVTCGPVVGGYFTLRYNSLLVGDQCVEERFNLVRPGLSLGTMARTTLFGQPLEFLKHIALLAGEVDRSLDRNPAIQVTQMT